LRRFGLAVVLAVAAGGVTAGQVWLETKEMKVRLHVPAERLRDFAAEVLEFYEVTPTAAVVAVTEPVYEKLKAQGVQMDVIVPDVRAQAMCDFGFFHTYEQLRDTWAIIARDHPSICRLDTIGISAGGRLLLAMKVSDNPTAMEGEPRICFDFTIHGNENNGSEIAHYALLQLVTGYGSDPQITYFVNEREIWLCPMDNPDGLVSRSRYNANGVDCNRNYGYSWNGGGPSVFSETEANCFYHLAEENPMSAWSQYHSGATSAMWPWFYTTKATQDSLIHAFEMQRYGQICNYGAYQISRGLYPGYGGSTDWYYGARGALGYAIEVCSGQPSPPSEIDTINRKNWTAMKEQIQRVNRGVMGYVTDSVSGQPLYALVSVIPPDWFTYTDSTGYYHKNLQAGTYSVRAWANGYTPKTVSGVVVPTDSFVRVNIVLTRDTAAPTSALKSIACRIAESQANINPTHAYFALGRRDDRRFSLGNRGWATFDMGRRTPIVNGAGSDFTVVEGDADPEACSVFVSNDWNSNWRFVGFGTGTQSYDLTAAGMSTARFVRIADDGDGGTGPYAGFDLDAIEAVVVNAPALVYQTKTVIDSPPGGNADGKLDPAETADLVVTLKNAGRVGVTNVSALLTTADEWISLLDSLGAFGALPPESTGNNAADRFRIAASAQTPREHPAVMKLILTGTDYLDSIMFTIVVGELRAVDPIPDGPRTPPRYWAYDDVDSGYAERPTYDWVEINGVGTRLTLSDDQTQVVSLPSGFGPWRYYGQSYTQVSICSNGWISPGSTASTVYQNASLPDGTQPANLCLLWDDLYPPSGNGVWYYHDAANHRFVVEFDSVRKYSPTTSYVKGEFVIYDTTVRTPTGDNVVLLQYRYCNDFTSATVGIEDPTCAIGIELLYNGTFNRGCAPLAAGRAVKFTTQDPTGVVEQNPAEVQGLTLRLACANPARAVMSLEYAIAEARNLDLAVYDGTGRRVRTLAAGPQRAGRHAVVWNGRDGQGRQVPAGVYWVRIATEQAAEAVKAILVR